MPAISPPGICTCTCVQSDLVAVDCEPYTNTQASLDPANLGELIFVGLSHLEVDGIDASTVLLDKHLSISPFWDGLFLDLQHRGIAWLMVNDDLVLRMRHEEQQSRLSTTESQHLCQNKLSTHTIWGGAKYRMFTVPKRFGIENFTVF